MPCVQFADFDDVKLHRSSLLHVSSKGTEIASGYIVYIAFFSLLFITCLYLNNYLLKEPYQTLQKLSVKRRRGNCFQQRTIRKHELTKLFDKREELTEIVSKLRCY